MKKTDILVIGSSAAGLVAALNGKRMNPEKEVTVITKQAKTMIPCGIPYIFGSLESSDKNILPSSTMFEANGITEMIAEVLKIDKDNRKVVLFGGEEITYEKLVIATGSQPISPKWLPGIDKKNVFSVPKDKIYIDEMKAKLQGLKRIVTIGAGFIGVEMSDELNKVGKEVTLIERLPNILGLAFDEDVAVRCQNVLSERGVKIMTGVSVKEIIGEDSVKGVLLENGEKVEADAIILSLGYIPNVDLAKEAGLQISDRGCIMVDEYMRTDEPHIFAIGDCAEKRDFVTRKPSCIMLASTACAEARVAAMNLYKLSAIKTFSGTISIFATAIGDHGFGVAGLTETIAQLENFDYVTGEFEGVDRHPGCLPGNHKQYVKLIVGRESGVILGGEVAGGLSAGELTNTIGMIIENRMTVNSLLLLQIGTHPLLTASPAGYPLVKAAENAAMKMMK